jgi:CHC2 zinc finger
MMPEGNTGAIPTNRLLLNRLWIPNAQADLCGLRVVVFSTFDEEQAMAQENGSRPEGWVDFSRAKKVPFDVVVEALELSGKLKRQGNEYKGVCPLHGGDKDSFGFNVEKGLFHCFGCKRSGNLLDFVNIKLFDGRQIKEAAGWLISLVDGSVDNDIPVLEGKRSQGVKFTSH